MCFTNSSIRWILVSENHSTVYITHICLVPEKISFSKTEEEILAWWNKIKAFETSVKRSEGLPEYSFYDGPPFATGLPHYGHILAGTIKVTLEIESAVHAQ